MTTRKLWTNKKITQEFSPHDRDIAKRMRDEYEAKIALYRSTVSELSGDIGQLRTDRDAGIEKLITDYCKKELEPAQPNLKILELRREVMNQWFSNHAEHCGARIPPWPHAGVCHWPVPPVILAIEIEELIKGCLE